MTIRYYYYCAIDTKKQANSILLLVAYMVFFMHLTPDQAYGKFTLYQSQIPLFRDASAGESTFFLSIPDVIRGLIKARQCSFFDFSTFDFQAFDLGIFFF